MFCMNCGTELPDNAKFCINCGNKVIQVKTATTDKQEKSAGDSEALNKAISFRIGDETIEFRVDREAFFEIEGRFVNKAFEMKQKFIEYYSTKVNEFDGIFELALPYIDERISETLNYGHKVLQEHGVTSISKKNLKEMAAERISAEGYIEDLLHDVQDIQEQARSLRSYRENMRANRGYWEGGGFGLGGAIKGVVTAGILNAGTGIVRGIVDGITDKRDRQIILARQQRVYERQTSLLQLKEAVEMSCVNVGDLIVNLLVEKAKLKPVKTNFRKRRKRIDDAISRYKKKDTSYDELLSVICDGLRDDPAAMNYYSTLYLYAEDKNIRLQGKELAEHFGLGAKYMEFAEEYDGEELREIERGESLSQEDVKTRIKKLQLLRNKAIVELDTMVCEQKLQAMLS